MKRADKNKLVLKELIDKMFEIAGHPLKMCGVGFPFSSTHTKTISSMFTITF